MCLYCISFLSSAAYNCYLNSFPTRRSSDLHPDWCLEHIAELVYANTGSAMVVSATAAAGKKYADALRADPTLRFQRSEEHTSELQSRGHLVCRLLLEKKKKRVTPLVTVNEI